MAKKNDNPKEKKHHIKDSDVKGFGFEIPNKPDKPKEPTTPEKPKEDSKK